MRRTTAISQGVIGGAAGAGVMSVLRMAARRWGHIDLTPPQATKAWLASRTGLAPNGAGRHHLLDSLIHLGVGTGAGALFGALIEPGRRPSLPGGALFGLGVWAVAFGLVAPALGITRSPVRGTWRETAVNVAAHLAYGTSVALVTGELGRQAISRGADPRSLRARVG